MELAISCRNLCKTYLGKPPVVAVNNLNLEVRSGSCFGLLGPNGAGKTTTLEILEGIITPDSGDVQVLGRSWLTDAKWLRSRIGIALQETKLSERQTVGETVTLFRSFYDRGISPEEAIALVSLEGKTHARLSNLSGGQKQRVALACSLVGDPDLLFLDEPTTGLDPQSRRQVWDIARSLIDRGKTILLTTHYMDEAEQLCSQVAVVDHGATIATGSPRDLIRAHGGDHRIEAQFSGVAPQLDTFLALPGAVTARVEADQVWCGTESPHATLPALLKLLEVQGCTLLGLGTRAATLEDVFVNLTGRHLREESMR